LLPSDIRRPGRGRLRLGRRRLQSLARAHVLDVGRLYRLTLVKASAGSQLYAATERARGSPGRRGDRPAPGRPGSEPPGRAGHKPLQVLPVHHARHSDIQHVAQQDWAGSRPPVSHADLDEGHYFTTE